MSEFMSTLAEMFPRLTGPLGFRFIVQPLAAAFLGMRDGRRDNRSGEAPYFLDLLIHPHNRRRKLNSGIAALLVPITIGIVLDLVAQQLIFEQIRVFQAVVVGTFLIGLPYVVVRGLANRMIKAGVRYRR